MRKILLNLTKILIVSSLYSTSAFAINPVFPSDYPDPSAIRYGKYYYSVATSSEWAPVFPIMKSKNMVDWKNVGSVFPKRPKWAVGNFWAPEISMYKNKFYIYYVGRKKNGPLSISVATSDKPDGKYTDHEPLVGQSVGSIDPMPIADDKGQRYLIWKEDANSKNLPTPIWIQKMAEDGLKLIDKPQEILRNDKTWEANLIEAPYVMKKNDYYYMFYSGNACCGNECNYAMGVARSKTLTGKWEKYANNPILKSNEFWKCPGHGSIFNDGKGKDFLIYHAYEINSSVYVGREGLIDQVTWNKDGWPSINNGNGASQVVARTKNSIDKFSFKDDFMNTHLKSEWQWPQDNEPNVKIISRGNLVLSQNKKNNAVLAIPSKTANYTAQIKVNMERSDKKSFSGISAYGDAENFISLGVKNGDLYILKKEKNKLETPFKLYLPRDQKNIYLKIDVTSGYKYKFLYSKDGKNWENLYTEVLGIFLPPWDRGIRIALVSMGNDNGKSVFQNMKIIPK
ncbi:MAG: family 43 glycosylhydrolase [Candidatus Sericytochromatia bacterium]|nr:family 43 glycosylhydrolase [Candidatus Sericytochromatia bacterium]